MKAFRYEDGCAVEELTEKFKEMIAYMKTDEYRLERGGNGPYWDEGGELTKVYLEIVDRKGAERRDTLTVPIIRPYAQTVRNPTS